MECVISTRQSNEILRKAFEGKRARHPIFYIKYGPPSSGKGSIMLNVLKRDNLNDNSLITIDVDKIIESNPLYIEKRDNFINTDNFTGKESLYFKYRREADIISTQMLNKAILDHFDVAWETTGTTVAWTIQEIKRIKKKGYDVTVVYPLVPVESLITRSKEREKKTGQTPASADQIRESAKRAIINIKTLIDHVDNIYIYDNSGKYGEEYMIIEINNKWEWTKEDNHHGPGLNRKVKCVEGLYTKFSADVTNILKGICRSNMKGVSD